MSITRRLFLRGSVAIGAAGATAAASANADRSLSQTDRLTDDGPLLADDVTGTTAYADWEKRRIAS